MKPSAFNVAADSVLINSAEVASAVLPLPNMILTVATISVTFTSPSPLASAHSVTSSVLPNMNAT